MSSTASTSPKNSGRLLRAHALGALLYEIGPTAYLGVLFVAPMGVLLVMSFLEITVFGESGGFTFSNYVSLLSDATYLGVVWRSFFISTVAMLIMLALAMPLAYLMAFRMRRTELLFIMVLVLADQLNPLIRVFAIRLALGRNGIINLTLQWIGIIDAPIDVLLFSEFAVILAVAATFIPLTKIPIYASLKAVDVALLEAADDLGAGIFTRFRKILLPLTAPGIFVAILLVYIPILSAFFIPALVGGRTGYMIGNAINEQVIELGNWGIGSAMSFLLLAMSAIIGIVSFLMLRVRRLETT